VGEMTAPIPDIVSFLETYEPEKLQEVRQRHPEASTVLKSKGVTLGRAQQGTEARLDAARIMLNSVGEVTAAAIADVGRKLHAGSGLDVCGRILALLASSGVMAASAVQHRPYLVLALGTAGFAGTAAPLVAKWLQKGISGQTMSMAFAKLQKLCWDAMALSADLDRISLEEKAKLDKAIEKANDLAREAFQILNEVGFQPSFKPV